MPANHQIREVDLIVPAEIDASQMPSVDRLLGRYLVSAKSMKDLIEPSDLALMPILSSIGSDDGLYLYQLAREEAVLAELLDVGSRVYLCTTAPDEQRPFKRTDAHSLKAHCFGQALDVFAVHRETLQSPGNWLMLRLPLASRDEFGPLMAAEKRFVLVATNNP
jgi:hypothetical protein